MAGPWGQQSRAGTVAVPSIAQTLPEKGKGQVVSKVSPGNPNEYSGTAGNSLKQAHLYGVTHTGTFWGLENTLIE